MRFVKLSETARFAAERGLKEYKYIAEAESLEREHSLYDQYKDEFNDALKKLAAAKKKYPEKEYCVKERPVEPNIIPQQYDTQDGPVTKRVAVKGSLHWEVYSSCWFKFFRSPLVSGSYNYAEDGDYSQHHHSPEL